MNSVHQSVRKLSQEHTKIIKLFIQLVNDANDARLNSHVKFFSCISKGWLLNFTFRGKQCIFAMFYL